MSARDSVRRLLESATMNARAVISAMKTFFDTAKMSEPEFGGMEDKLMSALSHALQNKMGADRDTVKDMLRELRDRQTIGRDHL